MFFCLFLKIFRKDIGEHITPTATNRTREDLVLVYNRVPKCSSTSMYKLVKELAVRNKFKFSLAKSNDIRNELRTRQKERALVAAVKKLPKHGAYVRHIYNPDWERLGLKVNLVNMIRDPISRMASWFYFVRFARKIFFLLEIPNQVSSCCVLIGQIHVRRSSEAFLASEDF